MPADRPFLTDPHPAGTAGNGAAPNALFDLAVNRAALAVRGSSLESWHARTRFARRIPLEDIRGALARRPGGGEWHWRGGPAGEWVEGKAPFP